MANPIIQAIVMVCLPMAAVFTLTLLVILVIYMFFYIKKDQKADALLDLYRELVDVAIRNYEPHMLALYRTPSEKGSEGCYPVVFKGDIIGYNRINLYTSFEELYQSSTNKEAKRVVTIDEKELEISKDEIENVKRVLDECGGYLNVIVYRIDKGWTIPYILKKSEINAVLCFDTQVSGLSSLDGKVIIHAVGTESHGFYFEIPSGSRDKTKIIMGAIETLTWIRMVSKTLSNISTISDQSLSINPALNQVLSVKTLDQPIQQVKSS